MLQMCDVESDNWQQGKRAMMEKVINDSLEGNKGTSAYDKVRLFMLRNRLRGLTCVLLLSRLWIVHACWGKSCVLKIWGGDCVYKYAKKRLGGCSECIVWCHLHRYMLQCVEWSEQGLEAEWRVQLLQHLSDHRLYICLHSNPQRSVNLAYCLSCLCILKAMRVWELKNSLCRVSGQTSLTILKWNKSISK